MNFMKIVNTMKISNYSLIFLSKDNATKIKNFCPYYVKNMRITGLVIYSQILLVKKLACISLFISRLTEQF